MMAAVDQDDRELQAPIAAPVVEMWPLKGLCRNVSYEVARRACERGDLRSTRIGGRIFCTEADFAAWLAATGRGMRG